MRMPFPPALLPAIAVCTLCSAGLPLEGAPVFRSSISDLSRDAILPELKRPADPAAPGVNGTTGQATARQQCEAGLASMKRGELVEAMGAFRKAIEIDPKYPHAHMILGLCHLFRREDKEGFLEMQREIDNHPDDPLVHTVLARVYAESPLHQERALHEWQKVLALDPQNQEAVRALHMALTLGKKIQEDITLLETYAERVPSDKEMLYTLVGLYLRYGQKEKGIEAIRRNIHGRMTPRDRSEFAYKLAETATSLDLAMELSMRAVQDIEAICARTSDNIETDLENTALLLSSWDTLAWVHLLRGDLVQAEKYARAAWRISLDSRHGKRLALIYERQGKKREAKAQYSLADPFGASSQQSVYAQKRENLKTFHVPVQRKKVVGAPVLLVFNGKGLESVKVLNGDESMKVLAQQIKVPGVSFEFPDDGPERIVTRAILTCGPQDSTITLIQPTLAGFKPIGHAVRIVGSGIIDGKAVQPWDFQ